MSQKLFDNIVAFLQGASWAFVLIGAALVFKFFLFFSFVIALLGTFVYVYLALFILLAIDNFQTNRKILKELQKKS